MQGKLPIIIGFIVLAIAGIYFMSEMINGNLQANLPQPGVYSDKPLVAEPMPVTSVTVSGPVVETRVHRPVTRTRTIARRPNVTIEKEIDYESDGDVEIEYDYDHHYVRNGLHKLGHKIFH